MLRDLLLPVLLFSLSPPALDAAEVRDGARSDKIDAIFADYAEGLQPVAAVMVIRHGRIVHAKGTATPTSPRASLSPRRRLSASAR